MRKMIEVKLSIEEYNRLYLFCLYGESYFYCKKQKDSIIFVHNPESDYAIAHVKMNTPEGRILSHYTECLLDNNVYKDGNIMIHNVCMGEYADCHNCKIGYCTYSCEKGISKKLDELDEKLEDIQFVDSIPNRKHHYVKKLEEWGETIGKLSKDFFDNPDSDMKKICETADMLKSQINSLLDKWEYKKKEYIIPCEAAKGKYLCTAFDYIEDVRRDNATIARIDEIDRISRCIINALRSRKIDIIPNTSPFSKINLIKFACKECECSETEAESVIMRWIEAGLMYETNLGNIGMHVLFA